MKINLIGMILNNAGRSSFDRTILDDNGKPLSAADSLHTMIMEYAKVINGGTSDLVTVSREVSQGLTSNGATDAGVVE
jgi:hypothetical protein